MRLFSDLILTRVCEVLKVYSRRGQSYRAECRPMWGLSLCTSGKITYSHEGKRYVSDPSCAILLPQGAAYDLYRNTDGVFPLVNFQAQGLEARTFRCLPLADAGACLDAFEALQRAVDEETGGAHLMECAYRLFALVEQEAAPQFGVLRPAEAYLREHLGDPELTNARLAAAANVSEVYFRRLFRQKYGTSPRQYIVAARVGRAKQLLTGTRDSVTAIAAACGFSDIFHFCRTFRAALACTPTEYRSRSADI